MICPIFITIILYLTSGRGREKTCIPKFCLPEYLLSGQVHVNLKRNCYMAFPALPGSPFEKELPFLKMLVSLHLIETCSN